MSKLQVFQNNEFGEIRTQKIDGKIYFVGADVAKALGYARPKDAIIQHCKGAVKHRILTNGGKQKMNVIPEGDLYRLIANSQLPTAQRFENWVFDEVLPTIRQTGAYMTPETIEKVLLNPDTVIELATQIKTLQLSNAKQKQIIGELKPKADYLDRILQSKALVTITSIAKDYGMSGQTFNKLLHDLGVQFKQGEQWLLYAKYHALGYTHSETVNITRSDGTSDVKMNTKWTQKGRLFLYDLLKENSIYPTIEQSISA